MKQLLLTLSLLFAFGSAFSQVESEVAKNFRFGLKASPSISWLIPDKVGLERDGLSAGFGYGLQLEFRLADNYSFASGLDVTQHAGSMSFGFDLTDSTQYRKPYLLIDGKDTLAYNLTSRKYTFYSVDIPLTIKMKTKEIGYLTYYGQFGLNLSYIYKSRTTSNAYIGLDGTTSTLTGDNEELDVLSETNFLRTALQIGIGAEYNLAGSTSLMFGINWNNGFTRVLKKESDSILVRDQDLTNGTSSFYNLSQEVKTNYIALTVGVLF